MEVDLADTLRTEQKSEVLYVKTLRFLLTDAMKVDFNAWFREYYVNEAGITSGSSNSLLQDPYSQGGGPTKKRRTLMAPITTPQISQRVVSSVHAILFRYCSNPIFTHKIKMIQKWWRQCINLIPKYNGTEKGVRLGYIRWNNESITCPLTLEPIPVNNIFKLISPDGCPVVYTCSALIKYVLETFDFRCPLMRFDFNIVQMRRLQRKYCNLESVPRVDIVNTYNRREFKKKQKEELECALEGLERVCVDIFWSGIELIEKDNPVDETVYTLENEILPEWRAHTKILLNMSMERCKIMLQVKLARLKEHKTRVLDSITENGHKYQDRLYPYMEKELMDMLKETEMREEVNDYCRNLEVQVNNRLSSNVSFVRNNARTPGNPSFNFSSTSSNVVFPFSRFPYHGLFPPLPANM